VGRVGNALAKEAPLSAGMTMWRTSTACSDPDPDLERVGLGNECEVNDGDLGEIRIDEDVDG